MAKSITEEADSDQLGRMAGFLLSGRPGRGTLARQCPPPTSRPLGWYSEHLGLAQPCPNICVLSMPAEINDLGIILCTGERVRTEDT